MPELLMAFVVMLVMFFLASVACGRELLRSEIDVRSHLKKGLEGSGTSFAIVAYPSVSGPRFSPRSILRRSSARRRGLRPARPAFFSPARPFSRNSPAH